MHQELHTETQMAIEGLGKKVDKIASLMEEKSLEEKVDRIVSRMDESASSRDTMLALKVQPKWIDMMREEDSSGRLTSSSGEGLKTEELRLYPPEEHCPNELLKLLTKRIFIVANGEMYGSFKLGKVRHYKKEQEMVDGSDRHRVTSQTAPGGPKANTSFRSFVKKAFPGGGTKKGCFGWPLKDLRWFQGKRPACDRPKKLGTFKKVGSPGAKPRVFHDKTKEARYKGIKVPYFLGQELGQVFCRCAFPAALDVHTAP